MKVIQCMCVTLSSKVNRQGHGFVFNIFDILDLENVRIDTKINFVSCLQPEIWKVMQKGVWPWFSKSYNKDGIFSLSPLDSLTLKTYPWEIFPKNSDGKTKIQGGVVPTPPGRPKVDFYLGHLRVNKLLIATFMFRYHRNCLPSIFSGYFCINFTIHNHFTRGSNKLHVSFARTDVMRLQLRICGPKLWNTIDPAILSITLEIGILLKSNSKNICWQNIFKLQLHWVCYAFFTVMYNQ